MDKVRYLPQRIDSSSECETSTDQRQQRALYASERARLLLGQYRKGDANDPDVYVASIAAILSDYPPETMRYVTDPRTGIAANPLSDPETGRVWTGMPDPANVKRGCELHYAPTRRLLERENQARKQIEERKLLGAPKGNRPTYADLQAKCAAVGLHIGKQACAAPIDAETFREKHGISREEWDAIPNRA